MCGVIGLVYEREMAGLGVVAAELLQALEYRGYDSTGAAVQGEGQAVRLVKGVGAPSVLVHELGITGMSGRVLCGQVRWATFGAVDDLNAQPHLVRCKAFLYGAHNGNVTNCDDLKLHLRGEGHEVLSDNDGEMVVHTVEHCFARELEREGGDAALDPAVRGAAMRRALVAAAGRLEGSYAAVVVDPVTATVYAVKQGSSLYFGVGSDPVGGRFAIASSDLSCVLKLTRTVVPLHEGEMVEFSATAWGVHAVVGQRVKTPGGERAVEADAVFDPAAPSLALAELEAGLFDEVVDRKALLDALYADYPLIYVTGPDERDVALTVSQVNTHKIRGAKTVVIAEDHPALRQAAAKAPADNPSYQSVYIDLPRTNDRIAAMFSATVVLQRLALKMSELKADHLDRLGVPDHGVHPDVPKNVSKSITVD